MANEMLKVDPEVDRSDTHQLAKAEIIQRLVAIASRVRELETAERIVIGSLNSGSVRSDLISAIANWKYEAKQRQAVLTSAILNGWYKDAPDKEPA